jgi:predicted transport protein
MKIYNQKNSKLTPYKIKPFKLEKEIQDLIENNLEEVFSLEFVKSEFTIKNFRVDTLGYDYETNSFVIVEYKRDRNFSVIDQGYTYMSLLLNNKSDFILEYNESKDKTIKRGDIDWTQSRVIFVSPQFTEYQKHSINFKDVPFELWEVKRYEGDLIGLVQHKNTSTESISTISMETENVVSKVSKEVKVYNEEYHFTSKKSLSEGLVELYNQLKNRILSLGDDVNVVPRKIYIGFKRKTNFFDVHFLKEGLWCWINLKKGELDDPKNITRDVSSIGHYGNGDYEIWIKEDTDLDYVMFLINQSYKSQDK